MRAILADTSHTTAGVTLTEVAMFVVMDFFKLPTCMAAIEEEQMLSHAACTGTASQGTSALPCGEAGGAVYNSQRWVLSHVIWHDLVGVVVSWHFSRTLPQLEALPIHHWRAKARRHK